MEIVKANVYQDFCNGVMSGNEVVKSVKLLKDARHFYANGDCDLDDNTVMYEVYSYSKGEATQVGNLNWGLTVMKPVMINQEYNMTRGHFHVDRNCAEIYFCLHGEGLLLFMDETGHCFAEEMRVGSIHHIDGRLAHRLVNTGKEELRVGACWPSTAGHDYKQIEDHPFTVRIMEENGKAVVKEEKE